MSETSTSASASLFPFSLVLPLLVIGFLGCVGMYDSGSGCQGALNAQSKAVYTAAEFGGWTK